MGFGPKNALELLHAPIEPLHKLILMDYFDRQERQLPPVPLRRLAQIYRVSDKTLYRALQEMETIGYALVQRENGRTTGFDCAYPAIPDTDPRREQWEMACGQFGTTPKLSTSPEADYSQIVHTSEVSQASGPSSSSPPHPPNNTTPGLYPSDDGGGESQPVVKSHDLPAAPPAPTFSAQELCGAVVEFWPLGVTGDVLKELRRAVTSGTPLDLGDLRQAARQATAFIEGKKAERSYQPSWKIFHVELTKVAQQKQARLTAAAERAEREAEQARRDAERRQREAVEAPQEPGFPFEEYQRLAPFGPRSDEWRQARANGASRTMLEVYYQQYRQNQALHVA